MEIYKYLDKQSYLLSLVNLDESYNILIIRYI